MSAINHVDPPICRCQNSREKKAVAEAVAEAADAAAGSGGIPQF